MSSTKHWQSSLGRAENYNNILDQEPDVGKRLISAYTIAEKFYCIFMIPLMMFILEKSQHKDEHMALKEIVMPPIKGLFRVLEKSVLRPDSGLPWDMVRAMIVCEDMKTIMAVLKYIAEYPKIVFLEVNDRFKEDKNGWADCALYITC